MRHSTAAKIILKAERTSSYDVSCYALCSQAEIDQKQS